MLVLLVVNFDHTDRCSSLPCLLMDTLTLWRWRRLASRNSCAREQNLSILLTSNLTIFSLSLAVSRWETSQRVPTSTCTPIKRPNAANIYCRQAEHVLVTKAPARLPRKWRALQCTASINMVRILEMNRLDDGVTGHLLLGGGSMPNTSPCSKATFNRSFIISSILS